MEFYSVCQHPVTKKLRAAKSQPYISAFFLPGIWQIWRGMWKESVIVFLSAYFFLIGVFLMQFSPNESVVNTPIQDWVPFVSEISQEVGLSTSDTAMYIGMILAGLGGTVGWVRVERSHKIYLQWLRASGYEVKDNSVQADSESNAIDVFLSKDH